MPRNVIVSIPTPYKGDGTGSIEHTVPNAKSSFDAARRALSQHTEELGDDDVITVILAERSAYSGHAKTVDFPKIEHLAGAVRGSPGRASRPPAVSPGKG